MLKAKVAGILITVFGASAFLKSLNSLQTSKITSREGFRGTHIQQNAG
jgi:hypothetical protein